ncbi:MAG TPA: glycerol-3-phosphate dehydrogenase [Bauldia sp.]|nr:glycerol-3-phosphate dehydrogenase [Bauldia sp.]
MTDIYDLAIIGGGINGCGIARDAAGRGLSVFLCEKGDLAGETSSASTKLIHGGLRYLEHYAFRLVREALKEREVLLRAAPHIIRPQRFVLPYHKGLRPRWLMRIGLFLYDHLGGRKLLPATRDVALRSDPAGAPLQPAYAQAFEYSDCTVDDSRLVVLNAVDARTRGASINRDLRCVVAEREGKLWKLALEGADGERFTISAKALVNAGGPWVADVLDHVVHTHSRAHVRLVKGSHIVVRRLFEHDRAYVFQNADGRIVFAIPYEDDFTLIGTTDDDYHGDPAEVAADSAEIAYLLTTVADYFKAPVTEDMIVWTYSGVRPLYDAHASSAQEAPRDYVLDLDATNGQPPVLSIFGGKITTYRRLAEHALEWLGPSFPGMGPTWTAGAALPGGLFPVDGRDDLIRALAAAYPFLSPAHARRLVRAYGTRAQQILTGARHMDDLGRRFGADLTEAEVAYLMAEEWARTAEDVLWRRSKLGLRVDEADVAALDAWMAEKRAAATPVAAVG